MVDPRWEGLWTPDRPDEDVLIGTGRDQLRRGGTVWVTGRHIREAVLGVLLKDGYAMSAGQILDQLYRRRVRLGDVADPRKAVSDVLRYQLRIGRVRRVGYGRYVVWDIPRSTSYRMMRRLEDRSWPWAWWEVADSRPSMDVPVPPGSNACPPDGYQLPDDPLAGMLRRREIRRDIQREAAAGPVRSDGWPSAS